MDEDKNAQTIEAPVISSDELLLILSRFTRLYQKELYRSRLPYGPYRGQSRVLHLIADNDGLNQKELAALLDIRSPSMSELLDKLERSDLITREKDETDKRVTRVFLSSEGRKLVDRSQNQDDFAEQLFEGLTDGEKGTFHTILKKLCVSFEAQALLADEDNEKPLPPPAKGPVPPPLMKKRPPLKDDGPVPPHPVK